jgi:diguanylate cyclase (GGDEF)-like protein
LDAPAESTARHSLPGRQILPGAVRRMRGKGRDIASERRRRDWHGGCNARGAAGRKGGRSAIPEVVVPPIQLASDNIVPLRPPAPPERDPERVLEWALAAVAEAEQRVAELQARVAQLENLSMTDELTGLLNRRGFQIALRRALALARRGGPSGALLFADLDGFKQVNDRCGHLVGDEVLRRTGAALAARVRSTDSVARLGGDEFAVLLLGSSVAAARHKARSIAAAVGELSLEVAPLPAPLGVSFGIAAFRGDETEEALLRRADLAMYGRKRRRTPPQHRSPARAD